ncbi:MAG: hypothetical protein ABIG95_00315 [Candidatus Woesearchaeota archaeon]
MQVNIPRLNSVFRLLSTEPKAMLIYWMLSNHVDLPILEISEGICSDLGLDRHAYRAMDTEHLSTYFNTDLKGLVREGSATVQRPLGDRSVPREVRSYRLVPSGKDLEFLMEIANHALYSSAHLSGVVEGFSLKWLLAGNHGMHNSAKNGRYGAPGMIAGLLYLAEAGITRLGDLADATQYRVDGVRKHIEFLQERGLMSLVSPEESYCLVQRDVDAAVTAHGRELWCIDASMTCTRQLIDYLRVRGWVSKAELVESVGDGKYTRRHINAVLSRLWNLDLVIRAGPSSNAWALITEDGRQVVDVFLDPLIATVYGDRVPIAGKGISPVLVTDEMRCRAVVNHINYQWGATGA